MAIVAKPLEGLISDLKDRIDSLERKVRELQGRKQNIEMLGGRVRSISNPVRNQDATPKAWVEALVLGGVVSPPGSPTGEDTAILYALLLGS